MLGQYNLCVSVCVIDFDTGAEHNLSKEYIFKSDVSAVALLLVKNKIQS